MQVFDGTVRVSVSAVLVSLFSLAVAETAVAMYVWGAFEMVLFASVSNHCGNKMHKSESYKPLESFIFVCTVEIFGIDLISFLSFKTVNCKCPLLFVFLGWDLTDLSVVFSVFCSSAMTVSDRGKFAFNCDWSNVVLV